MKKSNVVISLPPLFCVLARSVVAQDCIYYWEKANGITGKYKIQRRSQNETRTLSCN
jgi:hypothetical protein